MLTMALKMSSLVLSTVLAQAGEVSLQKALDRPVTLKVTDATIQQVFDLIAASSGAKIVIDKDTFDALPYGDQTRLSVTLSNATLRGKLSSLLSGLALEWKIVGEEVRIVPSDALYRICRRATYDELTILAALQTTDIQPPAKGGPVPAQLSKAAGKELETQWHVIAADEDKARAFARADKALPATGAVWLDALCHGQGWTWYLWGDNIVILDRQAQLRRQMEKVVSLRYKSAELVNVLQDLARQARVMLLLEPGVMRLLPSETRTNFNLIMADASVAQALEVISGATGLQFSVTDDGLKVSASSALKSEGEEASTQPARKRAPFFVKFSVPSPAGRSVEVFMRGDELPQDLQNAIIAEKEQLIIDLRKSLNVKPADGDATGQKSAGQGD